MEGRPDYSALDRNRVLAGHGGLVPGGSYDPAVSRQEMSTRQAAGSSTQGIMSSALGSLAQFQGRYLPPAMPGVHPHTGASFSAMMAGGLPMPGVSTVSTSTTVTDPYKVMGVSPGGIPGMPQQFWSHAATSPEGYSRYGLNPAPPGSQLFYHPLVPQSGTETLPFYSTGISQPTYHRIYDLHREALVSKTDSTSPSSAASRPGSHQSPVVHPTAQQEQTRTSSVTSAAKNEYTNFPADKSSRTEATKRTADGKVVSKSENDTKKSQKDNIKTSVESKREQRASDIKSIKKEKSPEPKNVAGTGLSRSDGLNYKRETNVKTEKTNVKMDIKPEGSKIKVQPGGPINLSKGEQDRKVESKPLRKPPELVKIASPSVPVEVSKSSKTVEMKVRNEAKTQTVATGTTVTVTNSSSSTVVTSTSPGGGVYSMYPSTRPLTTYIPFNGGASIQTTDGKPLTPLTSSSTYLLPYYQNMYACSQQEISQNGGRKVHATTYTPEVGTLPSITPTTPGTPSTSIAKSVSGEVKSKPEPPKTSPEGPQLTPEQPKCATHNLIQVQEQRQNSPEKTVGSAKQIKPEKTLKKTVVKSGPDENKIKNVPYSTDRSAESGKDKIPGLKSPDSRTDFTNNTNTASKSDVISSCPPLLAPLPSPSASVKSDSSVASAATSASSRNSSVPSVSQNLSPNNRSVMYDWGNPHLATSQIAALAAQQGYLVSLEQFSPRMYSEEERKRMMEAGWLARGAPQIPNMEPPSLVSPNHQTNSGSNASTQSPERQMTASNGRGGASLESSGGENKSKIPPKAVQQSSTEKKKENTLKQTSDVHNIPVGIAVARQRQEKSVPDVKDEDDSSSDEEGPSEMRRQEELRQRSQSREHREREEFLREQKDILRIPGAPTVNTTLGSNLIVTGGGTSSNVVPWSQDGDASSVRPQLQAPWLQAGHAVNPPLWLGMPPGLPGMPPGIQGAPTAMDASHIPITPPGGFKLYQDPLTAQLFLIPATNIDVVDHSRMWPGFTASPHLQHSHQLQQLMAQQQSQMQQQAMQQQQERQRNLEYVMAVQQHYHNQMQAQDQHTQHKDGGHVEKEKTEQQKQQQASQPSPNVNKVQTPVTATDIKEKAVHAPSHPFIPAGIPITPTGQAFPYTYAPPQFPYFIPDPSLVIRGVSVPESVNTTTVVTAADTSAATKSEAMVRSRGTSPMSVNTPPISHTTTTPSTASGSIMVASVESTNVVQTLEKQASVTTSCSVASVQTSASPIPSEISKNTESTKTENEANCKAEVTYVKEEIEPSNTHDTKSIPSAQNNLTLPDSQNSGINGISSSSSTHNSSVCHDFPEDRPLQRLAEMARICESQLKAETSITTVSDDSKKEISSQIKTNIEVQSEKVKPESETKVESTKKVLDTTIIENNNNIPETPYIDPQVLQAADGLELLSALAEQKRAEQEKLTKEKEEPVQKVEKRRDKPTLLEIAEVCKPKHDMLIRKEKERIAERMKPKTPTLKKEYLSPVSSVSGFSFHPGTCGSAPDQLVMPSAEGMDAMELEMRMRLAELQRRYKQKQRELAKLQPKKDKEDDKHVLKRGPGRPRKKHKLFKKKESSKHKSPSSSSTKSSPDLSKKRQTEKLDIKKKSNTSVISTKKKPLVKPELLKHLKGHQDRLKAAKAKVKKPGLSKWNLSAQAATKSVTVAKPEEARLSKGALKSFQLQPQIKRGRGRPRTKNLPLAEQQQVKPKVHNWVFGENMNPPDEKKLKKMKKTKKIIGLNTNGGPSPSYSSLAAGFNKKRKKSDHDDVSLLISEQPVIKKRKPGRPKKYNPTKPAMGETETIVAKKPKHYNLLSMRSDIHLPPKKPVNTGPQVSVTKQLKVDTTCGTNFLTEEWTRRRSERIFLSEPSPSPSPSGPNTNPFRSTLTMPTTNVFKKKKTRAQDLSQKVKRKYTKKVNKEKTKNLLNANFHLRSRIKYSQVYTDSESESEQSSSSSSDSEGDNIPLSELVERPLTPEPRSCNILKEELKDGLRVLLPMEGLFHEGKVKAIQPPDVYGVIIEGERGGRPHIYSQEEILKEAIVDVRPGSPRYVPEGTRVCAYWSQQFTCLYPGTVSKGSPNPNVSKNLVHVEFDDGDSGRIPIDHIRLIPQDFPVVSYDPNPLMLVAKRRTSRAESRDWNVDMKDTKPVTYDTNDGQTAIKVKRGPGRPPKKPKPDPPPQLTKYDEAGPVDDEVFINENMGKLNLGSVNIMRGEVVVKRGRGRPRKHPSLPIDPKKKTLLQRSISSIESGHPKHKFHLHKKHGKEKRSKSQDTIRLSQSPPIPQSKYLLNDDDVFGFPSSELLRGLKFSSEGPPILHTATSGPSFQSSHFVSKFKPSSADSGLHELESDTDDYSDSMSFADQDDDDMDESLEESEDESLINTKTKKKSKSSVSSPASVKARKRSGSVSVESKIAAFLPARQLWKWSGKSTKRPGMKGKAKKEFYKSIQRGKETIMVGDCAVFLSTGRPHLPFIGRIESMWEGWGGNMVVKVKWFYHPEETKGGRKLHELKGALFQSTHEDENDVQTISHKCEVIKYDDWKERKARSQLHDNNDVYYLAGTYEPTIGLVKLHPSVAQKLTLPGSQK